MASAGEEHIHDDSARPEVDLLIIGLVLNLLWGHKDEGSTLLGNRVAELRVILVGEPEVGQFQRVQVLGSF